MNTSPAPNPGEYKIDIEKLLEDGKTIQLKPQGYSMYPIWVPGRDQIIVAPIKDHKLKRGDVVLFRREGSILVIHRIWKRKGDEFYLVGDNQSEVEGPIYRPAIKGILVEIIRNGKHIRADDPIYRLLTGGWLFLRPFRPVISGAAAKIKKLILKTR